MPEISAETIREGRRTLAVLSRPHIFTTLVAISAMAALAALVWAERKDHAQESAAQVSVLRAMARVMERMDRRLVRLEVKAGLPILPPPRDDEE